MENHQLAAMQYSSDCAGYPLNVLTRRQLTCIRPVADVAIDGLGTFYSATEIFDDDSDEHLTGEAKGIVSVQALLWFYE
jgi:hypothetical protein